MRKEIRLLLVTIILLDAASAVFAQADSRSQNPYDETDGVAVSASNGTHVEVDVRVNRHGTPAAESAPTVTAVRRIPGAPLCGIDGTTIWVDAAYGCNRLWTHFDGNGLPRKQMKRSGDRYVYDLGCVPEEDFTVGFAGLGPNGLEDRWLPGNVGNFCQGGSPFVAGHDNTDGGGDFLMKANGRGMRLATPAEVSVFVAKRRAAKRAQAGE